jgi:hypothetical protein
VAQQTPVDWNDWHREYDDPSSRLSRRLAIVQHHLRRAIDERTGAVRIVSMCAGEGRDVIGVLRHHPRRDDVSATLVELDPDIAAAAEASARGAQLDGVRVVCGDAALTDTYADAVPADIVLACGIFGNIPDEEIQRTVEHLPCFCAPGATVLWTRGRWPGTPDVPAAIRRWFAENGFDEVAFIEPADNTYRVGVNRLTVESRPLPPGVRLFTFFR